MEVRLKGVNKGIVAIHIVKHLKRDNSNDFRLIISDDHRDEPILSVMRVIGLKK